MIVLYRGESNIHACISESTAVLFMQEWPWEKNGHTYISMQVKKGMSFQEGLKKSVCVQNTEQLQRKKLIKAATNVCSS